MKPRELQLFLAVARTGSVTAGALQVGMSQPSASAMLRAAEERLGFELFDRSNRRVVLTGKGRALLAEAANVLAAMQSLEDAIDGMGRQRPGRLVTGVIPAVSTTLLPGAARRFQEEHPRTVLNVRAGTASEVVQWAAEEVIDVGVVLGPVAHEHVTVRHLADLRLACAMPDDHPLCAGVEVTLEQLDEVPYVAYSRHLPLGNLTAQALASRGLRYRPSVEITQNSAACAMASAGCGVAIMDSLSALHARKQGLVVRPLRAQVSTILSLVWPKSRGLTYLANRLSDALTSGATQLAA